MRFFLFVFLSLCWVNTLHAAPQKASTTRLLFTQQLTQQIDSYNQKIIVDRARIQQISEQYLHNDEISEDDFNWLKTTAEYYQLIPKQRNDQAFFDALLTRIDVIPSDFIIALATIEGAWHYPTDKQLSFLCSQKAQFCPSNAESLQDYFHVVNTHPNYQSFRNERTTARQKNYALSSRQLISLLLLSPPHKKQIKLIGKLLPNKK